MTNYISSTTASPSALLEHKTLSADYVFDLIPDMLHQFGVKW